MKSTRGKLIRGLPFFFLSGSNYFLKHRSKELETIRRIIEIVSTKLNVMNEYLIQRS